MLVAAGGGVASVSLNGSTSVLTGTFAEGDTVNLVATCAVGNFAGWNASPEFGGFANKNNATTTFTIGPNDVTITAYCGGGLIQEVSAAACTSTPIVVTDSRDDQRYTIARLADGNCWMLDNLDLDLTSPTVVNKLTSGNTNASETALNYLKNGGGSASDQWAIDGLQLSNWTTTPNYSNSQALVNRGGICDGALNTESPCLSPYQNASYTHDTVIDKYGTDGTSATTTYNVGAGSYKVGTYYNYCAASAGSYCYGNGTSAGSPSGNAAYDICPAGWRMPTGGDSGEYHALALAIPGRTAEDTSSFQAQLSTPISGAYRSGTAFYIGDFTRFWSSTYYSSSNMYGLYVSGTAVNGAAYLNPRSAGRPVRCILK